MEKRSFEVKDDNAVIGLQSFLKPCVSFKVLEVGFLFAKFQIRGYNQHSFHIISGEIVVSVLKFLSSPLLQN